MKIPRLLRISLISLLLALPCAAPRAAQSAPDSLPWLTPLFGAPAPVTDFRTRIPPLAMHPPGAAAPGQLQLQLGKDALSEPSTAAITMQWQATLGAQLRLQGSRLILRARKRDDCYAMRSYRIKRDNPVSDTTSFAGYSTCQATTDFQAKNAADVFILPARSAAV
jgi:hypothetical protein